MFLFFVTQAYYAFGGCDTKRSHSCRGFEIRSAQGRPLDFRNASGNRRKVRFQTRAKLSQFGTTWETIEKWRAQFLLKQPNGPRQGRLCNAAAPCGSGETALLAQREEIRDLMKAHRGALSIELQALRLARGLVRRARRRV